VAVVFGGRSTEHEVSCLGAGNVIAALDPSRYEVIPIGIARDGRWVLAAGSLRQLAVSGGVLPTVETVSPAGAEVAARLDLTTRELAVTSPTEGARSLGEIDLVLPLLHGAYGEDGTIQGLLEMAGTRYAGAGVLASAVSMDKEYMKLLFAARGLPVAPYVVVRDSDWRSPAATGERKRVLDEIRELGWPVFVKPARGGSSVGTSRASSGAELEAAIEAAQAHDPKVLVEAAVPGIEIECGVLEGEDGGPPDASVPGQVVVGGGADFYDFEAKYLAAETHLVIPPPIPGDAIAEIRRLAGAAFQAVSCEGLARVDFFYTPAGQVILNEINTMPGMTQASGFPRMWQAAGLPLPRLLDRVIATALRKPPGLH
jgi:D-alanine--D-alanine ligase